jgi:hypothetical protein
MCRRETSTSKLGMIGDMAVEVKRNEKRKERRKEKRKKEMEV